MRQLNQISLLLLLSFILQVHCGAYWEDLETKERVVKKGRRKFTEVMEYCITRPSDDQKKGLMLFKGSHVKFRDCFVCDCNAEGLQCKTTYGLMFMGYSECKVVIDDCTPLLVNKYHDNLRCHTNQPLTEKLSKGYHVIKVGK